MPRVVSALAAVAALLGAVASQATAAETPPQVTSTSYEFAASSHAAKGAGTGIFGADLARGGSGLVRVVAGRARVEAGVRRWEVRVDGSRVTLTLRLVTTSSSDRGACRLGTRAVATLVDDAAEPANDSVKVAFPAGKCTAFSRFWSATGTDTARVDIEVVFASE